MLQFVLCMQLSPGQSEQARSPRLSLFGFALGTSLFAAYSFSTSISFSFFLFLSLLSFLFVSTFHLFLTSSDRKIEAAPAQPRFSKKDTTVVFILGGPGAGKGTQCAKLVSEFGFVHLSAGDLLRDERNNPGSQYGELIHNYIKEGKIVPMDITIALLENAMAAEKSKGHHRFLVDGFPRMVDQGQKFEKNVCEAQFVLFFECPEAEMEKRLLKRGESSGRVDDNIDSIRKRFRTFIDATMPVMDYYGKQHKVKTVSFYLFLLASTATKKKKARVRFENLFFVCLLSPTGLLPQFS